MSIILFKQPIQRLQRALPSSASRAAVYQASFSFHTSRPNSVKVGDGLPDLNVLTENSPGNKINLSEELTGRGLVIGVPAAFSPSCSSSHIPGYINHHRLKDAGQVFVVSVNDPFVYYCPTSIVSSRLNHIFSMKAWGSSLDSNAKSGIRFLGDPTAKFSEALDLTFDGSAIFGGNRSKRYALVIEDGKVKEAHVEPDNTGVNVSKAEKVLG